MNLGYLYKRKDNYIKNKAKTLLIPYLTFSLIIFCYYMLIECKFRKQSTNGIRIFLNIFIKQGGSKNFPFNAVMWFLPCLFITETIFYYIEKIDKKRTIIIFILAIMGNVYPMVTKFRLPFCLDAMLVTIGFYYVGYILREINIEKIKNLKYFVIGIILTTALAILEKGANVNELKYNNFILFYLTAIIGTFSIFILSMNIKSEILKYIGKNSMIIMCIHEPIKRIVIKILSKITTIDMSILRQNIVFIMIIAVITIIAIIPIIKMINKLCPQIIGTRKNTYDLK